MSEQIQFSPLINLTKLSKLTGINYDRLYMVVNGKTKRRFDANERLKLRLAIKREFDMTVGYLSAPTED